MCTYHQVPRLTRICEEVRCWLPQGWEKLYCGLPAVWLEEGVTDCLQGWEKLCWLPQGWEKLC